MTSSRPAGPFAHDIFQAFRAALPVLLAGLVTFCVLVPVSTSMVNACSIFNVNFTHDQLKYQLYAQPLGPVVNAACVVLGMALALALFRFMLEKRSTTAYFSLGIDRRGLFASRALVGFAGIAFVVCVPFAVSLALNNMALGIYEGELAAFAYVVAGYVVVALVSFAVTAIATMFAGTLFEALAFSVILLGGVTVVLWGIGAVSKFLLVGDAMGITLYDQDVTVAPSLLESLSWANPVAFFLTEGASKQFFQAVDPVYYPEPGSWQLVAGWAVAYVALSALGAMALVRRSGEQAEMAGKSPALSLVVVCVIGFAVVAVTVMALGSIDIAVALAAGAALFVLVSLALLFGPFRGRAPRRVVVASVAAELAVMAAAIGAIAAGGFGYASYIPATQEVESVEISYDGSPSYLSSNFSGVSGGTSYYFTATRSYRDASTVESIRSIHQQLIASAREAWATDAENFEQTVVPYDISITYHLKDGGTAVRYYRQATVGELSALRVLDNDAHAKELRRAVVTGDTAALTKDEVSSLCESPSYVAYRSGALYVADGILNQIVPVDLTAADRASLQKAMADDLDRLSASDIYAPKSQTRAVIMFTTASEVDVASFGYSFNNALSYVTDSWTSTMTWLEDHGVMAQIGDGEIDPRVIESMTFEADDPYASVNAVTSPQARYFMGYRKENAGSFWVTQDFGAQKTVSDQEDIAKIVPNLRMGYGMDGGYLVQLKLRGLEAYVYCYLPAELAPDDL